MKVNKLIKQLQSMPQDAEVRHLWDGEPRTNIECVYLSKAGDVITADYGEVCYSTSNRPVNAPTANEERFWRTPLGHAAPMGLAESNAEQKSLKYGIAGRSSVWADWMISKVEQVSKECDKKREQLACAQMTEKP